MITEAKPVNLCAIGTTHIHQEYVTPFYLDPCMSGRDLFIFVQTDAFLFKLASSRSTELEDIISIGLSMYITRSGITGSHSIELESSIPLRVPVGISGQDVLQ